MDLDRALKAKEKAAYEKPMLTKHGKLRDLTAGRIGSPSEPLGCTRF